MNLFTRTYSSQKHVIHLYGVCGSGRNNSPALGLPRSTVTAKRAPLFLIPDYGAPTALLLEVLQRLLESLPRMEHRESTTERLGLAHHHERDPPLELSK